MSGPSSPDQRSVGDELATFLMQQAFLLPNFNDTFGRACADTEQVTVGDGVVMANFWRRYGWHGLVAIAAKKRGVEPLPEIAERPQYKDARGALDRLDPVDPKDDPQWALVDEFELR